VVGRFSAGDPRSARWLTNHSSTLIREIIEEQRELAREKLAQGMREGRNPRSLVDDLVGIFDRSKQQRVGGIIGLTRQQAEWGATAEAELRDPARWGEYLRRKRRDKRLDRVLRRAQREGRGLTADEARKLRARYEDRLLALRGETIARTEAITALHQGQDAAIRGLVDGGKVNASQVKRVWDATGDSRTRSSHLAMEGQRVGMDEPFTTPSGARLLYPSDTSLGASASETIQCRCTVRVEIDYFEGLS
jgi:hypothetical protein